MQQENIPIKVGLLELLYGSQGTQFVILSNKYEN